MKPVVHVNTHYTRSVNLERDADSIELIKAYIPTSRALRTFAKFSSTFNEKTMPRSWSLIGPYGSGKSSFSVFSSHLLADPVCPTAKASYAVLSKADSHLVKSFKKTTKGTSGFLRVLVTGAPQAMGPRIIRSMANAAENYWSGRKGKNPTIVNRLNKAASEESITTTDVIELVQELQTQLQKSNSAGLLLVIDELGKFLEYEARHYGANDIYLLQALAEHACKGQAVNLYVFALLHQSFEQYAKGLGENLKSEWSKVQGRFEEVPFLESAEQVLRVVTAAFEPNISKKETGVVKGFVDPIVSILHDAKALPGVMTKTESKELFKQCYPLHPVSAILLPLLCQKVAQNERTLFSYLGSHEECGFQQALSELKEIGEFIHPDKVFDYFVANQSSVMTDHLTHRRWVEVVTAIERLGDAEPDVIKLLKVIGVLNIIGVKGGFKASKELLIACSKSKAAFNRNIKVLSDNSVVTFRKFSGEYRVWQGSDFDLEHALQEQLNNLGRFSLAEELNKSQSVLPIVARRYTIETGTLRYFLPLFVDAKSYKSQAINTNDPRIIFYLAAGQDDEALFNKVVCSHFSPLDIVVLCLSGTQLYEAVAETQALKRVHNEKNELNTDAVAMREFEDRLSAAEIMQSRLLQNLVDQPSESQWFNGKRKAVINNKRQLQGLMSRVLEGAYNKTPIIHNELINRDYPSAQAVAARNKLLYLILNESDKEDFGIEKFPAEKAIYRSLLLATGIHKENAKGEWLISEPDKNNLKVIKSRIHDVWERIDHFVSTTESGSKSFIELNEELQAVPYGVKAGILPILYIAYYRVYQHEIALYEGRNYQPYFSEEMLERFVKRPGDFKIQRFRIKGLKASIFNEYAKALGTDAKEKTLLSLAGPLARKMSRIPEYTQKTKEGVGTEAIRVRSAFNLSKSPESLLFKELPKALGFEGITDSVDEEELKSFSESLIKTLAEIENAYGSLLKRQRDILAQLLGITEWKALADLRQALKRMYADLASYTIDTDGVVSFLNHIADERGTDQEWLERLFMNLAKKPCKSWTDSDEIFAERNLRKNAQTLLDLKGLKLAKEDFSGKEEGCEVYLLRSTNSRSGTTIKTACIDENMKKGIAETTKAIHKLIEELPVEYRFGALAQIVDGFFSQKKPKENTENSIKKSLKLAKA